MAQSDSEVDSGSDAADAGDMTRRTVQQRLTDQMPPAWHVRVHQFHEDGEPHVRAIARYPDSAVITVAPATHGGYKTSVKTPEDRHAHLVLHSLDGDTHDLEHALDVAVSHAVDYAQRGGWAA